MGLTNLRLVLSRLTSFEDSTTLAVFYRQEEIPHIDFLAHTLPNSMVNALHSTSKVAAYA
jgi:hypothetical protein